MSSTYSSLKIELIATGEGSGTWGDTTNSNWNAVQQAIAGMVTLDSGDFTANVATLTLTNSNALQDARALVLKVDAGAISGAGTINVPAVQKPLAVINSSSYAVTVKVSGQTGVSVPAGASMWLYNNGTDVQSIITSLNSVTLSNLIGIREKATISATAATGTINFDVNTQSVLYYTTNSSGNWTLNVRGSSSATLDSVMSTGESLTVAFLATNGGSAYYQTALTVDGTSVTPKWQNGAAPTGGYASSVDIYTITIVKTGSATFTAFESQTQFA